MSTISNISERNMTLERLNSLYELIGRMNSVYELTDLLEFVVDRALSLTSGRRGLLLLDDEHEHTLQEVAVARGEQLDERGLEHALEFVSTTVIKDVLDQGEPRLVFDLQIDQRYEGLASDNTAQFKRVRSVLAVPLKVEQQLVGLIYIDHPRQGNFSQADLDFLSAFAAQAALAINRARQHQQQVNELTRLNELSRSVVQVLDLDEVLTRIVYEAIQMLQVETGSVLLLNETTDQLTFNISVSNGQQVHIPATLDIGQGIAGWVAKTGEVACVNDVMQDPRWFGEVDDHFNTRSILCVPLQINGRILGVLQVLNRRGSQGFDQTDVTRLSAFAASATIAIENAHLFQEASEARSLRALVDVALTLSSTLDLETILNTSLEKLLDVLRADAGAISLIDDQTQPNRLSVKVSRGLPQTPILDQTQIQALEILAGLLLKTMPAPTAEINETLVIDEVQLKDHPESEALFEAGIYALALVPLKIGNELKGALIVMSSETTHIYSTEEIGLLTGIARIIGLAVQNATFYEQMSAKTIQLTYLNEIGAALTSRLEVDHVLEVFIDGANALLETERTSVFLIDDQTNELVLRYSNPTDTNIRLPIPWRGVAGWVARHDEPALVNDVLNDERHESEIALETGFDVHSILCVPLKIEDRIIGVVEALNKIGGQGFSPQDKNLLIELSHWAAIAIQNARLHRERIQAQKLQVEAETRGAMADLILNMAHTMNNVVGAIRVWVSDLGYTAQRRPQTPLAQSYPKLLDIQHNTEEALELIRRIRDPLETINAKLNPTDIHVCLAKAIQRCWRPENVLLNLSSVDDLPLVWANAEGLEEAVFYNLISNATQALLPNGGQISISVRPTEGNQVEILIADDGPGIPPALQERVFQPGISGREDTLGIGLWLAQTFIRRFGGQIQFTSQAGEGTVFRILLRIVDATTITIEESV